MFKANSPITALGAELTVFEDQFVIAPQADQHSQPLSLYSDSQPESASPLPAEMLKSFEAFSGWVVEFQESLSSHKNRSDADYFPQGVCSITDLSEEWPAKTPAAHRAKCDLFIEHLSGLVNELQETKSKLASVQASLVALESASVDEGEKLQDTFAPRYSNEAIDQWQREYDASDFELCEPEFDPCANAVNPPFEGWFFGGSTGINDGHYVDWKVCDRERITLIAGQLETIHSEEENESSLWVDPLTNEYGLRGCDVNNLMIYDARKESLTRVDQSPCFRTLRTSQCLIASTSDQLAELATNLELGKDIDVGRIASQLSDCLEDNESVLVLGRAKK